MVLSNLSLKDAVAASNVCKTWREHLQPRRVRHLLVRGHQLYPRVASSKFNGYGEPLELEPSEPLRDSLATTAGQTNLDLIRQNCTVVDLPATSLEERRKQVGTVGSLLKVHVIRRFGTHTLDSPVNTIVDFDIERPLTAECKRYVMPNVIEATTMRFR
jgi:hypothetical protein